MNAEERKKEARGEKLKRIKSFKIGCNIQREREKEKLRKKPSEEREDENKDYKNFFIPKTI